MLAEEPADQQEFAGRKPVTQNTTAIRIQGCLIRPRNPKAITMGNVTGSSQNAGAQIAWRQAERPVLRECPGCRLQRSGVRTNELRSFTHAMNGISEAKRGKPMLREI